MRWLRLCCLIASRLCGWLRARCLFCVGYGLASLRVIVLFLCVAYGFAPILRGFLLDKVFTRLCGEFVLAYASPMLLSLQLDPQTLRLT